MTNFKKPEWAQNEAHDTSRVAEGVKHGHDGFNDSSPSPTSQKKSVKRKKLSIEDYVKGVLNNDRSVLAQTITLIESNAPKHMDMAQQVLQQLLPHTGKSIRVGITGVPGAGKSTFIEALGQYLCKKGHKVAVLAVDPSSTVTRGSILGDKTRMEQLSREKNAFIRPSPSGGTLGGVTRKSRETMLVCEAAGFDVILVETVGVGQNEVSVRNMVDFFLLLAITGAGDELQGIKKGIMELADAILVHKADGDNLRKAKVARADYNQVLHYLQPATEGWMTQAHVASSYTGEGISDIWNVVETFQEKMVKSGVLHKRRESQTLDWINEMVEEQLLFRFKQHPVIKEQKPFIEQDVLAGRLSPTKAAKDLLQLFDREHK
ncbi:methylmalonyl Co-A mutase-associated GTPase MeaB [Massilibacterium senegalense]|uniref:methylmalonyl Co-A mutase-associated GTPase MeaB n=1 Tax=Massilibacterium senegalense TaxID=1632858 RepID=UPI000A5300B8